MARSFWRVTPPFGNFIGGVLFISADKQMVWADAEPIVTVMAHAH